MNMDDYRQMRAALGLHIENAYDEGYRSGWWRGFATCLVVAVLTLVLLVVLG